MHMIVGIAVMLMVLSAIFMVAPKVMYKIDKVTVITDEKSPFSQANLTAAGVSGAQLWTDNAGMLLVAVLIVIVAFIISVLLYFGRGLGGGQ